MIEKDGYKYLQYFKDSIYTYEKTQLFYDKYIESLQEYIKGYNIHLDFLTCDNLITDATWEFTDNSYSSYGLIKLGEDIQKIGTYFPLCYTMNKGIKKVSEGHHRVIALKSIKSNIKILSLDCSYYNINSKTITIYMLFPSNSISDLLKGIKGLIKVEKIENGFYKININSPRDAYTLLIIYSMFISEIIFKQDKKILGDKFINDENTYNLWRDENRLNDK